MIQNHYNLSVSQFKSAFLCHEKFSLLIKSENSSTQNKAKRKLDAWHGFHKTGNYGFIKKAILLNWRSYTVIWNSSCATFVTWNWDERFPTIKLFHWECCHLQPWRCLFLQNVGIFLQVCMVSQPRKTSSSSSPLWELQISPVCWPARNCLHEAYYTKPCVDPQLSFKSDKE
jgi:hypothetical protein